jgi:hypothetical protein
MVSSGSVGRRYCQFLKGWSARRMATDVKEGTGEEIEEAIGGEIEEETAVVVVTEGGEEMSVGITETVKEEIVKGGTEAVTAEFLFRRQHR